MHIEKPYQLISSIYEDSKYCKTELKQLHYTQYLPVAIHTPHCN
jgi:hypothetical protein